MGELSSEQTDALKLALNRRYRALLEELRGELERSGEAQFIELAGRVTDSADLAVADMLADLGAAIIDRHVEELRDIEAALGRMVGGRYGECSDCGGEIGFARLKAWPTAKRCVVCQEQREKTYAHGPNPSL